MDRVFLDDFILKGSDYKHLIRARRLKEHDIIEVVVNGKLFRCKIKTISKDNAILDIVEEIKTNDNNFKIVLFQSILEKKKMETIFKICTAIGVSEFVPIITERTEPNKINDFNTDRNNEILKEAAQQSKGMFLPKINDVMSFDDAIKKSREYDLSIILYENEDTHYIKSIDFSNKSIALFVGPEGGFSEREIEYASLNGLKSVKLFSRILRSELAAFSAMSIINANMEDYES